VRNKSKFNIGGDAIPRSETRQPISPPAPVDLAHEVVAAHMLRTIAHEDPASELHDVH
jgi:hypothetical protein